MLQTRQYWQMTANFERRHRKAIEKIRAKLFDQHSAAEYGIDEMGVEVIPPVGNGLGGLCYPSVGFRESFQFWVRHDDGTRFQIGCTSGNGGRMPFTMVSRMAEFEVLDRELLAIVRHVRVSQPMWYRITQQEGAEIDNRLAKRPRMAAKFCHQKPDMPFNFHDLLLHPGF
jgi:hypothetical protein